MTDRKNNDIILAISVCGVVMLGNLGVYGFILSVICCVVPLFSRIDTFLPYNSRTISESKKVVWNRMNYVYVGKNVDSYLIMFSAYFKQTLATSVFTITAVLFLVNDVKGYVIPFSIAYVGYSLYIIFGTLSYLKWANPEFKKVYASCFCMFALCLIFSLQLCLIERGFNGEILIFSTFLIGCFSLLVYSFNMRQCSVNVHYDTQYRIPKHGLLEEPKSFILVTKGNEEFELERNLIYPIVQNSGDYLLLLNGGISRKILKNDVKEVVFKPLNNE